MFLNFTGNRSHQIPRIKFANREKIIIEINNFKYSDQKSGQHWLIISLS